MHTAIIRHQIEMSASPPPPPSLSLAIGFECNWMEHGTEIDRDRDGMPFRWTDSNLSDLVVN